MDPKKLIQKLARHAAPRTALSMVTGSDADLVTDDEVEILEDVADGKDPFEIRRREKREEVQEHSDRPIDIHFSSLRETVAGRSLLARKALRDQAGKFALYDVDPQFGKKNPELHKFLMRVHRLLKEGEEFYREVPEDPEGNLPAAPRDPVKYKFQSVYRDLKEGMKKLRDHYRNYGNIQDKWVKLLRKRFSEFMPVFNRLKENHSQARKERAPRTE